ncbi:MULTISPECIES: hypothetical protein [unclassified Microbacterium]|nr:MULTISPECIES: hypothetical protein [unclassified Microbacterium]MBT2484823.1 hypothetical protein [Microbacterium sp. ISL-108]
MNEEEETATPYQVYVFDCPRCGGRTEIGDQDPAAVEECADCGVDVVMGR